MTRVALRLPKLMALFLAIAFALSAFGGYQLYRATYNMNNSSLQRAEQMLALEEDLDNAAINLGKQIQEWKDMLLRASNDERYNRHRQAFVEYSVNVQKALLQAKVNMQNIGLNTEAMEQLSAEHKALLAKYVLAHSRLDQQSLESSRAVDRQVIGLDRNLQHHMTKMRAEVELLAQQQLRGAQPEEEKRYLWLGLLGAVSLLFMALAGFAFASGMQFNEDRAIRYL